MIITIDGPSGTGKTTVAKALAERLHFVYFDTGAMYRALTWFLLKHNVPIDDEEKIQNLLREFSFNVKEIRGEKKYFIADEDVTDIIRSRPVTEHVSAVSALKIVREALLDIQHQFALKRNVVFEGRDLGSVVFPHAEFKVFLTADPQIRAERRLKEFTEKYPQDSSALNQDTVLRDMQRRDTLDASRKLAPLTCPPNAYVVDTSDLSLDQVVEKIISHLSKAKKRSKKGGLFYRVILFLAHLCFKLLYRHKVYGTEHFCEGGAIIASNHVSYLDPPALAISSPEELHFLAKESLFKNFFLGPLIRALNTHPVKGGAGDITVLKLVCKLLSEGKKVLLFPEGKRGNRDALNSLKPGVALLISRSKAAVIPAYVHGTLSIWDPARKFPRLRGRTACVFGSPLFWSTFSHLDKREAQEQLTTQLTSSINALKEWYHSGAQGSPP